VGVFHCSLARSLLYYANIKVRDAPSARVGNPSRRTLCDVPARAYLFCSVLNNVVGLRVKAMARFVLIGWDGPRGAELRKRHRPAHLEGLRPLADSGEIVHAGPLLGEDGEPVGSIIVFEAANLDSARRLAERDPYVVEGIFVRHEVYETAVVFP
jgi:uncharacterized protein YciI